MSSSRKQIASSPTICDRIARPSIMDTLMFPIGASFLTAHPKGGTLTGMQVSITVRELSP
jgi:hypothetical protein